MSIPAKKLERSKVHTSPSGRRYVDIEDIIFEELEELEKRQQQQSAKGSALTADKDTQPQSDQDVNATD